MPPKGSSASDQLMFLMAKMETALRRQGTTVQVVARGCWKRWLWSDDSAAQCFDGLVKARGRRVDAAFELVPPIRGRVVHLRHLLLGALEVLSQARHL